MESDTITKHPHTETAPSWNGGSEPFKAVSYTHLDVYKRQIYHWYPKMYGRFMNETLGKIPVCLLYTSRCV